MSLKPFTLTAAIILISLMAITGGYLLGVRANQNICQRIQNVSIQPPPIIKTDKSLTTAPYPSYYPSTTPEAPLETWQWIRYSDATLSATFEYPATWKIIIAGRNSSVSGSGSDYMLEIADSRQANFIDIISYNIPGNLSLADFYRKYLPDGQTRFANIAFQEIINPHGVRFAKLIQPFVSDESRKTVHNGRFYGISRDSNADRDTITIFNNLINSFTFNDGGKQ
jgi:hypothetical protein